MKFKKLCNNKNLPEKTTIRIIQITMRTAREIQSRITTVGE